MKFIEEFQKSLVEIYLNDNYDEFSVGYIISEDNNDILVQLIHPMGFKDGMLLISKEDINKIKKNSSYLNNLEILMEENKKENILNSYIFNNNFSINTNSNILDSTLSEIMSKKLICTITSIFNEEKTFGYIDNINENFITLHYQNEKSLIKKEEIKSISIETILQKKDILIDSKNNI